MKRRASALLFACAAWAAAQAPPPRSPAVLLAPERLALPASLGYPLASLDLKRQLDSLRQAGPIPLAGRSFRFGLAADAEFRTFFLSLDDGKDRRLDTIAQPRMLVHGGLDFDVGGGAAVRVTIKPRWEDALHDSVVGISLVKPARGPGYRCYSGELLDMLERRAVYFRRGGRGYYLAYVSDVDPVSLEPSGTRSIVFFEERRFRPRLWRLPESALSTGIPARVRLGRRAFVLLRRPDGLLVVYSGAP